MNKIHDPHLTTRPDEAAAPERLHEIFSQLNPRDVEQFHKGYQLWSLQQLQEALINQIEHVRQKSAENLTEMARIAPSALSLANLAQLQACGVDDIELLDTMLTRGEDWLDHTIQLLERCERLDLIGGDYTEWCQHALEGAYDWLDSMNENGPEAAENPEATMRVDEDTQANEGLTELSPATEELLLQKLMSEEGDDDVTATMPALRPGRITQPLPPLEEPAAIIEVAQPEIVEVQTAEPEENAGEDAGSVAEDAQQMVTDKTTEDGSLPLTAYAPVPAADNEANRDELSEPVSTTVVAENDKVSETDVEPAQDATEVEEREPLQEETIADTEASLQAESGALDDEPGKTLVADDDKVSENDIAEQKSEIDGVSDETSTNVKKSVETTGEIVEPAQVEAEKNEAEIVEVTGDELTLDESARELAEDLTTAPEKNGDEKTAREVEADEQNAEDVSAGNEMTDAATTPDAVTKELAEEPTAVTKELIEDRQPATPSEQALETPLGAVEETPTSSGSSEANTHPPDPVEQPEHIEQTAIADPARTDETAITGSSEQPEHIEQTNNTDQVAQSNRSEASGDESKQQGLREGTVGEREQLAGEEKKPQVNEPAKKRGFFKRLLAKIWHR
jgi:hypothetical protein